MGAIACVCNESHVPWPRPPHHGILSFPSIRTLALPDPRQDDIKLSRQNVTTIVKGMRIRPYPELQVQKIERSERTYGDFTQTFAIPQEYERKWSHFYLENGVLRIVFTQDADEDGLVLKELMGATRS